MSLFIEAFNQVGEQRAIEINAHDRYYGWVFYKHADGGWVTLRKATEEELAKALRVARQRSGLSANPQQSTGES